MGLISDFGKWIDKKFPDKVTVTKDDYNSLLEYVADSKKELADQDIRLKNICKEIITLTKKIETTETDLNKVKLGMGFKAMGLSPAAVQALQ
jgi:hypothetical protein